MRWADWKDKQVQRISEFLIGLLFGMGLLLSGMTDPGKVIGFLDLAGAWDPSLILVMGGAVLVGVFAFWTARKRSASFLGNPLHLPAAGSIDRRLVAGSLLFGVGWGLAGFCPGPALVSLGAGQPKAVAFVLAMLAGMIVFELAEARGRRGLGWGTGASRTSCSAQPKSSKETP